MTGKEKCRLLKKIRKEIAGANGIKYLTDECNYEGECSGTCPKCDAEIRYLDLKLNQRVRAGKKVTLSGVSLKIFEESVKKPNRKPWEEDEEKRRQVYEENDFDSPGYLPEVNMRLKRRANWDNYVKNIIYGFAVADALGVPVEFKNREELAKNPVTDMRGYGTHNMTSGTWSDDTSMTLATLDAINKSVNYEAIMSNFLEWCYNDKYTATHETFDVGITTHKAIQRYKQGINPMECGLGGEYDNGNGSLMRIIPVILFLESKKYFGDLTDKIEIIHNVSKLTHAHKRSQIGCGIYSILFLELMYNPKKNGVEKGLNRAKEFYENYEEYAGELKYYNRIFESDFANTPEDAIKSSGYIVDTLEAAIWCLLNTDSYKDCVLKAVNLGDDTDTVAAVAGGLAACLYGEGCIPDEWIKRLMGKKVIDECCNRFLGISNDRDDMLMGILMKKE